MKFSKAASFSKTLMLISVVLCVLGLTMTGAEMTTIRTAASLTAMVLIIIAVAVVLRYCRCPHCGKRIFFGVAKVKYCPNCRRDLETGKKVSKKKVKSQK